MTFSRIQEVAVTAVSAVTGSRRALTSPNQRYLCLKLLARIIPQDKWDLIDELDVAEDDFHKMMLATQEYKDEEESIVSRYEQAVDNLVDDIVEEWTAE